MNAKYIQPIKWMLLSYLGALILNLMPWSWLPISLVPNFLLVAMLYWTLRYPNLANIGVAWMLGLLVDLSTGGLFGQYALSFAVTAFFAVSLQRFLTLFSALQHFSVVLVLFMAERGILLLLKLFSGAQMPQENLFFSCLTGALVYQAILLSTRRVVQRRRLGR